MVVVEGRDHLQRKALVLSFHFVLVSALKNVKLEQKARLKIKLIDHRPSAASCLWFEGDK